MKTYQNIVELVGNTPLVRLHNIEEKYNLDVQLYGKVESYNPTGSIKDRASLEMILDALKTNKVQKGSYIIEATSGNTGISLAAFAKFFGLKCIIVMPDTMSKERINLMKAYGAEVYLSDGKEGMAASVKLANELKDKFENSFIIDQFNNPSNVKAHAKTAQELIDDLDSIDYLFVGIGTGGTITGLANALKPFDTKIIGIEPYESPLLSKGIANAHKIQGIGANFIPSILDQSKIDDIVLVKGNDAILGAKELMELESLFSGISSGAALKGAIDYIQSNQLENCKVVVILPDRGDRYYSTEMFQDA